MSTLIQLTSDDGNVRIGSFSAPGGLRPDGSVAMGARVVRPLGVTERDVLVRLVSGANRGRRLARAIGDAATKVVDTTEAPPTSEQRAAIEAVALELAGASMRGALARTTLIVTRWCGGADSVASMTALAADHLAESISGTVTLETSDTSAPADDTATSGWTSIRYEPVSADVPEDDHAEHADADPRSGAADGTFSAETIRDRLAARLLARDEAPLDGEAVEPPPFVEQRPRVVAPWAGTDVEVDRHATSSSRWGGRLHSPRDEASPWLATETAAGRWSPRVRHETTRPTVDPGLRNHIEGYSVSASSGREPEQRSIERLDVAPASTRQTLVPLGSTDHVRPAGAAADAPCPDVHGPDTRPCDGGATGRRRDRSAGTNLAAIWSSTPTHRQPSHASPLPIAALDPGAPSTRRTDAGWGGQAPATGSPAVAGDLASHDIAALLHREADLRGVSR